MSNFKIIYLLEIWGGPTGGDHIFNSMAEAQAFTLKHHKVTMQQGKNYPQLWFPNKANTGVRNLIIIPRTALDEEVNYVQH